MICVELIGLTSQVEIGGKNILIETHKAQLLTHFDLGLERSVEDGG
jgi:hypothetical protein